MTLTKQAADGWRSIGRLAAKRGTALAVVLTNNPVFDALIREGHAHYEVERRTARPKVQTDLFGNPLRKGK